MAINTQNGNTLLTTGFFPPVRAATTGTNITLSGLQTIDGIALNAGDRVLVKDQTDATTNGIYAASTGNWVRTVDAQSNTQFFDGMAVLVAQGAVNAGDAYICTCTDDPVVIGTSLLTFAIVSTIQLAGWIATSTTSITVGTGSTTFATQAGKSFSVGQWVLAYETSNPTTALLGQVTSYSGTNLVLNVTATGGSGTHTDWSLVLANSPAAAGIMPPTGTGNVVGPGSSSAGLIAQFADSTGKVLQAGGFGVTWLNVKDPQWGAKGDGVTNDALAIQAAINSIASTGGVVYLPAGTYFLATTITVKGSVRLVGASRETTILGQATSDITVVAFDSSCSYAGMEQLFVTGYNNSLATQNCVTVALNAPVVIKDCNIWYGAAALYTQGVDGYVENCFISGFTYALLSAGANWYIRCKFDTAAITSTYALFQAAASTAASAVENHFTQCDFSGSYTKSVEIIDNSAAAQSITAFEGCVFSSSIALVNAKATMFSACEIGSTSFASSGVVLLVGCYAFNPTVTGATSIAGCSNLS